MKKKEMHVMPTRYPPTTAGVKLFRAWQQARERELRYHPETAIFEALEDMGLTRGQAEYLWRSGFWDFCVKIAKGEAHILDANLIREGLGLPRVPIPVEIKDSVVAEVDYSLPYDQLPSITPGVIWDFFGTPTKKTGPGPCCRYLQNGVKRRTIVSVAIIKDFSVTQKDIDESLKAVGLRHALLHEAHAFFRGRFAGYIGVGIVAWGTPWFFDFMGESACGQEEYVPIFRLRHSHCGKPFVVAMLLNRPRDKWETETHHFLAVKTSEDEKGENA